jgi:hypothetical protein
MELTEVFCHQSRSQLILCRSQSPPQNHDCFLLGVRLLYQNSTPNHPWRKQTASKERLFPIVLWSCNTCQISGSRCLISLLLHPSSSKSNSPLFTNSKSRLRGSVQQFRVLQKPHGRFCTCVWLGIEHKRLNVSARTASLSTPPMVNQNSQISRRTNSGHGKFCKYLNMRCTWAYGV